MHTLSTRTMSALAFERGEEYDPGEPLCPLLLADLALLEQAGPVIGEDGAYERARRSAAGGGPPAWIGAVMREPRSERGRV